MSKDKYPSIFSSQTVLSCRVTMYSSAKAGEYPSDILQVSKLYVLRKTFED